MFWALLFKKMILEIDFIYRILAAFIAGAVIGIERQWQNKSAGLRTNTLVSIGAALFVFLSIQLSKEGGDVTRIVGQIVTGVGFIGAGIIFRKGFNVHGLNTAATIWCSAAMGAFAGAGFFTLTFSSMVIVLLVNIIITPIEKLLNKRRNKRQRRN